MSGWAHVCFVFIVCLLPVGLALGADSSALKAKHKAEAEGYIFAANS